MGILRQGLKRAVGHLAVLLDEGGRFVALHRVQPDINEILGFPHASFHARDNERWGIVPDRMPRIGARRRFVKRGVHRMRDGEEVFLFKEERA